MKRIMLFLKKFDLNARPRKNNTRNESGKAPSNDAYFFQNKLILFQGTNKKFLNDFWVSIKVKWQQNMYL